LGAPVRGTASAATTTTAATALIGRHVIRYGSHRELMRRGGMYAEPYVLQAAAYQ
jgi:hypothetical protein